MYSQKLINSLNGDIEKYFPHIKTIDNSFNIVHSGVSRMVMLDRYSQKDKTLASLKVGDLVVTIVRDDATFPTRAIGYVQEQLANNYYAILIENEYINGIDPNILQNSAINNIVIKQKHELDKPLELFYEQIAFRVATNLATVETNNKEQWQNKFYEQLKNLNFVPAGRILYGAGSNSDVTFFNCFVMPMIKDSRNGISEHRKEVMEIMSHGGGVGSNGSTLRPKGTVAKSVGGKSSGSVSWLNDLSSLTHLVEQGGSRRGAQMIMLADWHPDTIEFIVCKMQNPKILKWLKENSQDQAIREEATKKLRFEAILPAEKQLLEAIIENENTVALHIVETARKKLLDGGEWKVNRPEFLSGANISVTISHAFMQAVENDAQWTLQFPDLDNYSQEEKEQYDALWHTIGDIKQWEQMGFKLKNYYQMKARDLWDLISFCATYSAEPGLFFIDQANDMTNAKAYGMKVVATNPCGEQPLAPYSVCNLGAINLANFVNRNTKEILWDKLKETVNIAIRLQDNVIDCTPYFLELNKIQALGERRIGLGVMGLHDLLIWTDVVYGSIEGNSIVNKVFQLIAETAYLTSVNIAKEKGSFPFLKDHNAFINTGYMKKMNPEIRNAIKKYGIRNSHLLTIAPTGTTGTMVGVSTGLEPYFAFNFYRSGRLGKNIKVNAKIVDEWLKYHPEYVNKPLPNIFISAMELTPVAHADVQCIIQRWVDSSISKTVNAPVGYTVKNVEKLYMHLYKNGAKGGTVYVDGSRNAQVLSLTDDSEPIQEQLGLSPLETPIITSPPSNSFPTNQYRGIKQDRTRGTNIGDLCAFCNEGNIVEAGGCNTCDNCSAQLQCGL